ncbi:MAG: hypothetical protein Aurels2KO_54830 [Aureliella sp.]
MRPFSFRQQLSEPAVRETIHSGESLGRIYLRSKGIELSNPLETQAESSVWQNRFGLLVHTVAWVGTAGPYI